MKTVANIFEPLQPCRCWETRCRPGVQGAGHGDYGSAWRHGRFGYVPAARRLQGGFTPLTAATSKPDE